MASLYVLNYLKYFVIHTFRQNVSKLDKKHCQEKIDQLFMCKLIYILSDIYFGTKSPPKNQARTILNYIKSLWIIFYIKMTRYL